MSRMFRKPRSRLFPYRWALWVFVILFMSTVGLFWLLGHDLQLERVKDKPVKEQPAKDKPPKPKPVSK